jgi:hypothetical protein
VPTLSAILVTPVTPDQVGMVEHACWSHLIGQEESVTWFACWTASRSKGYLWLCPTNSMPLCVGGGVPCDAPYMTSLVHDLILLLCHTLFLTPRTQR